MSSNGNIELTPIKLTVDPTLKKREKASVFKGINISALKTEYLVESEKLKVVIPVSDGSNHKRNLINDIQTNTEELVNTQKKLVEDINKLALRNGNNNNITSLKNIFNNFKNNVNIAENVIKTLSELSKEKQELIKLCNTNNETATEKIGQLQKDFKVSNNPENQEIMKELIRPFKDIQIYNKKIIDKLREIDISEHLNDFRKNDYIALYKDKLYKLVIIKYKGKINTNKGNITAKLNNFNTKTIDNQLTILKDCKETFKNSSAKITNLDTIFTTKLNNGNNITKFETHLAALKTTIDECNKLIDNSIQKLKAKLTAEISNIQTKIKEKINALIAQIKQCINDAKNSKLRDLNPLKNDLTKLKNKFLTLNGNLKTSFNNIFKENENVKKLEVELSTILNGLEALFKRNNILNSRNIPSNIGTNNRSKANSGTTINFVNGKKYKKAIFSELKGYNHIRKVNGNTLLWKSNRDRTMKGIIKAKVGTTVSLKNIDNYGQNPTSSTKAIRQKQGTFTLPVTIKSTNFNKKQVKVQI